METYIVQFDSDPGRHDGYVALIGLAGVTGTARYFNDMKSFLWAMCHTCIDKKQVNELSKFAPKISSLNVKPDQIERRKPIP